MSGTPRSLPQLPSRGMSLAIARRCVLPSSRVEGLLKSYLSLALSAAATLATACNPVARVVPQEVLAEVAAPAVTGTPREQGSAWRDAKQTLDRRCVVCHGCYDSPCQLVLSSIEGIQRGATKHRVYDGARILSTEPTRLHVDARDVPAWRDKGFYPVLPEGEHGDPAQALLVRMLELKREHPLLPGGVLPREFEIGLDRTEQCPKQEEFARYAEDHPSWGMPYALPGLAQSEHEALVSWVKQGSPHRPDAQLAPAVRESIARWEAFLNGSDLKVQLAARYIYEHLFLGSIYFAGLDAQTFFRLVRSRTPPGEPIDEIATRRPFESPGTDRVYYRLARRETTKLAKTHMPYPLDDERLARYRKLFLESDYQVTKLPDYEPATAANPFLAFAALPVGSRYRFMLEEAHFTMSGFIKGPVCRGQVALDVIEDRFWVAFVDPESPIVAQEARLLEQTTPDLALPAEHGSNGLLLNWRKYAKKQVRFLAAKSKYLSDLASSPKLVTLAQVWDGDGKNPNAALTVLRHFDSATVVKGFVGGDPKTTWVVGYALLERIHYLLVAGFDVFGNVGHQLHSRLYMDFLRMEAEHNYVTLLPKARRRAVVDSWYRDTDASTKDLVYGKVARFEQETGIAFQTAHPERELSWLLSEHLRPVLTLDHGLGEEPSNAVKTALAKVALLGGKAATLMPETSFLEVRGRDGQARYFTLLRDSAHTNVAHLFRAEQRRKTDEDQMTLLRGFVGAYPNALFSVNEANLESFVQAMTALDSAQAYDSLRERFGVRRTDARFWQLSDRIHDAYGELAPLESGLFDFNRLDGR